MSAVECSISFLAFASAQPINSAYLYLVTARTHSYLLHVKLLLSVLYYVQKNKCILKMEKSMKYHSSNVIIFYVKKVRCFNNYIFVSYYGNDFQNPL